jgi:hypothetical protein
VCVCEVPPTVVVEAFLSPPSFFHLRWGRSTVVTVTRLLTPLSTSCTLSPRSSISNALLPVRTLSLDGIVLERRQARLLLSSTTARRAGTARLGSCLHTVGRQPRLCFDINIAMKFSTLQAAVGSAVILLSDQHCQATSAHRKAHQLDKRHTHGHGHHQRNEVELVDKRTAAKCTFPSDGDLVAVTPHAANGGWAMSPDQECRGGMWCPIACKPGKVMAQWDPNSTYVPATSMVSADGPFPLGSPAADNIRMEGCIAARMGKSRKPLTAYQCVSMVPVPSRLSTRLAPQCHGARPSCQAMRLCSFLPLSRPLRSLPFLGRAIGVELLHSKSS